MDRLVSLSVGTVGVEDFFGTFEQVSELAKNMGAKHDYVSVSSSVTDADQNDEPAEEILYYDENTLYAVRMAIKQSGLTDESATRIINDIQNAGILFRVRLNTKG